MRIFTVAALAATVVAAPAPAADFSGRYVAEGSCPAPNSAYRGTLTIRSNGLFHTLSWQIGTDMIVGTGMEHEGWMVIEFRFAGGQSGLMGMTRNGNAWRGNWAVHGSDQLCAETWVPTS